MNKSLYDNYVIAIVENGSLTKAAEQMGVSQPAISSGIKALEKELGITIFDRKKIPMELTAEGELYAAHIRKRKNLEIDFERRLNELRESDSSEYRVGGPVAYVESMITNAVLKVGRKNPKYRAAIKSGSLSTLINLATKGDIDCFVCTTENIPDNFEKRFIRHERIFLVAGKTMNINEQLKEYEINRSGKRIKFNYSMLNGQDFILMEEGQPLQKQMDNFFSQNDIIPNAKYTVNQVSSALNLAIKGGGICFASEASLECRNDLEGACIYALPDSVVGRNIYVAYDKEMHMSEACNDFIECLISGGEENE